MRFCQGVLQIQLLGDSPERFLNLCRARDISIWNIGVEKNRYCFCMEKDDFWELRQIARKTKTVPRILKKTGIPFYVFRWKRRYAFWIGFASFFGWIYFYSLFLWEVDIQGQYTHTREDMLRFLSEAGVCVGSKISEVDCAGLEEKIRIRYKDIGWVSAQIDGCHMIVEIRETNMPKLYEPHEAPVHLVADRDGIVESLVMRKGTPMVKAGDAVKAGDILISGIVDVVGDNDVLLRKTAVAADGDVVLRVVERYEDQVELSYQGKEFTRRSHYRLRLCFGETGFSFVRPDAYLTPFDLYDRISESYRVGPIRIYLDQDREYQRAKKNRTSKKAAELLQRQLEAYLKKIEEKGVIIEQNNVKITKNASGVTAKGTLELLEPAACVKEIQENEWRTVETDERNGEDN